MTYNKSVIAPALVGLLLVSSQAFSEEAVTFLGNKAVSTVVEGKHLLRGDGGSATSPTSTTKTVYLQKLALSDSMKASIAKRLADNEKPKVSFDADQASNKSKQLSMNDVPVLNQGQHGTCATFATTAAVDAFLAKDPRDYISQMCNLELGEYLHEQDDHYMSGWDGSFASVVLKQMSDYGIISKSSCDDLYPLRASDEGHALPIDAFNVKHEMVMSSVPYTAIADATRPDLFKNLTGDKALAQVKQALNDGSRVLIGTLLVENADNDGAGVNGMYSNKRAAWVLSPATQKGLPSTESGHEMVITGYNDTAVAVEVKHAGTKGGPKKDGKHAGVLTLRNSWGKDAGDNGEYYMSYDFFKAAYMELHAVGK